MDIDKFDFDLPKGLIAQQFVEPRDSAKLMVLGKKIEHKIFREIIDHFREDDVLVLNVTKVENAKIEGKKSTGAPATFIVEGKYDGLYRCRIQKCHPRMDNEFEFEDGLRAVIKKIIHPDIFFVEFNKDIDEYLKKYGKLPLPSYVKEKVKREDYYQTVYSKKGQSLAAPTAGLHFTEELLERIEEKGVKIANVCLDISFSTFLRVKDKNFEDNKLHEEWIAIDKKDAEIINKRKGRLVVCGTTSLRTLESFAQNDGNVGHGEKMTDIFIYPGYKPKIKPEMIITNFHLPKSSLLLMISAYIGREKLLDAYSEAIKKKYRFYSLGDAMLISDVHEF